MEFGKVVHTIEEWNPMSFEAYRFIGERTGGHQNYRELLERNDIQHIERVL